MTLRYDGNEPNPIFETDNPVWVIVTNEFYVRDINGKEIALYNGNTLLQHNVYGLDNIGKIDPSNHRFFYLKDHLGSIHAVIDTTNTLMAAYDYDAWGCQLEGRTYNADEMKYKFTGKQRDGESDYDYFGARYYDSRIGRWLEMESDMINCSLIISQFNFLKKIINIEEINLY